MRPACAWRALDYTAGRRTEAHAAVDALLEERPASAEASIAKARMLLLEGGRTDEAERHARAAIGADRTQPSAHYALGLVALQRRDVAAAEAAFDEVIRLNPRAAAAQLQLSRLQLARGDAREALASAEQAARQRPDDPRAAVLVARSLRAQGDLGRAERELATRLARMPEAAALHVEMGELALQRGQQPRRHGPLSRGRCGSTPACTTRASD